MSHKPKTATRRLRPTNVATAFDELVEVGDYHDEFAVEMITALAHVVVGLETLDHERYKLVLNDARDRYWRAIERANYYRNIPLQQPPAEWLKTHLPAC